MIRILLYWPFLLGLVIGYFLPLLDHLIYIFFTHAQELTSQRVVYLIKNKNVSGAIRLLRETNDERTDLIFHSNYVFIIVLVLALWLLTSSGSFLGMGLILGVFTHLLIDRIKKGVYHGAHNDHRL